MNQVVTAVKRFGLESKVLSAGFFETFRRELRLRNTSTKTTEIYTNISQKFLGKITCSPDLEICHTKDK